MSLEELFLAIIIASIPTPAILTQHQLCFLAKEWANNSSDWCILYDVQWTEEFGAGLTYSKF